MLRLDRECLSADRAAWEAAGFKMPNYDREAMIRRTLQNPRWLHFGTGNIFRAFIAPLQQHLLNTGRADTGIIAAAAHDFEVVERVYRPYGNLAISVGLRPDGEMIPEVVASIAESIRADEGRARLREIAEAPSLQIMSFCITEKGYALTDMRGNLTESIRRELEQGPEGAKHTMTLAAALLLERFLAGAAPVALLSLDNCSRNGDKLRDSVLRAARAWAAHGGFGRPDSVWRDFMTYLEDESRVSSPWSMIDKITPRPSESVRDFLTQKGVEGMDLLLTAKGSYVAPFVNAEIPQYLVAEDRFPAGRPPLEEAGTGVYFTDRQTVEKAERMKVSACLNPLHTALAIFGCLLGYRTIASEMENPLLRALAERIGYAEGMPVVADPGIFSPREFIREVLEDRFPNPFIPDTPQRIATDTSQKIPVRYGETIKAYMERPGQSPDLNAKNLVGIPLVIAAWFRYLLGVDDELRPMELSGDPLMEELRKGLEGIRPGEPLRPGEPESAGGRLRPFLSNPALFGADLYAAGLGEKVESMFAETLAGKGAVLRTLEAHIGVEGPAEGRK
ncbi:MAG: mannitol dehydrogenase family protein [Synergistaceae bacterium]|jgi:fructuronate reductase|nr:mannitol dehydrogenase family protein [Synergistaceae bacterium]